MWTINLEQPADHDAVGRLISLCFGEAIYGRAAQALRDGNRPITRLSFIAREPAHNAPLLGTVRLWPVELENMLDGSLAAATFLGPLAVHPAHRGRKIGRDLMQRALDRADALAIGRIFLVGDAALYEPFGFRRVAPCHITLPGGQDGERLMVRHTGSEPALPSVGRLRVPGSQVASQPMPRATATPYGDAFHLSA